MQNEKRREKGERKQESLDADQTSQTPRILRLRRLPTRWKLVKPVSSLFSGSSTSIYYTSTCSRCSTLEEGERAKLEFSLRALLRRIDRTLDQIGPTSVGPFVFQVPVRPRFASVDATSGDRGRRPGSTKRMILLDEYCDNTALHDTRRYERTIAKSTTFASFVFGSRENKAVNVAPFARHLVTLARWNKIVHRILNFLTFNATYAGVIQHEKDFNDTILLGNLLGISTCLPTGDLRVTCTSSR
ncbi:hypothetical protein V1477_007545, partial [Vespula maculifrons]